MTKPTQKQIKIYLKDIQSNFSALVSAAIWYEDNDQEDWASDIIGHIEKLTNEEKVKLLLNDLSQRVEADFNNYAYQRLWWALINENDTKINQQLVNHPILHPKLYQWYSELDNESETKDNLNHLLNGSNLNLIY